MGLFGAVDGANVLQGGVYFDPGLYKVKICDTKTHRSQKDGKDYFIVECEVLESDNEKLPPGSHASQCIPTAHIMGPVNIKAFVAAASDVHPTDEEIDTKVIEIWNAMLPDNAPWSWEQICEYAVGGNNPFGDVELDLECRIVKTKANKDFTKHFWSPA